MVETPSLLITYKDFIIAAVSLTVGWFLAYLPLKHQKKSKKREEAIIVFQEFIKLERMYHQYNKCKVLKESLDDDEEHIDKDDMLDKEEDLKSFAEIYICDSPQLKEMFILFSEKTLKLRQSLIAAMIKQPSEEKNKKNREEFEKSFSDWSDLAKAIKKLFVSYVKNL